MKCPTSGDALERIACELHAANHAPSLLDRLLDPAVLVSLAALIVALASLAFTRRVRRETAMAEGRADRVDMLNRHRPILLRRWIEGDREGTHDAFHALLMELHESPAIEARQIAYDVSTLDDAPTPKVFSGRRTPGSARYSAAMSAYRYWVDNPYAAKRNATYAKDTVRYRSNVAFVEERRARARAKRPGHKSRPWD